MRLVKPDGWSLAYFWAMVSILLEMLQADRVEFLNNADDEGRWLYMTCNHQVTDEEAI